MTLLTNTFADAVSSAGYTFDDQTGLVQSVFVDPGTSSVKLTVNFIDRTTGAVLRTFTSVVGGARVTTDISAQGIHMLHVPDRTGTGLTWVPPVNVQCVWG